MRKRILIGAIAAAVIAVAGYLLSQPKRGSLEWHKARYRASLNAVFGESRWYLYRRGLTRKAGQGYGTYEIEQLRKMETDRAALVRLGYLVNREIALANRTPGNVHLGFMAGRKRLLRELPVDDGEYAWVAPGTNSVIVFGSTVAVRELEAWVHRRDVPLKK